MEELSAKSMFTEAVTCIFNSVWKKQQLGPQMAHDIMQWAWSRYEVSGNSVRALWKLDSLGCILCIKVIMYQGQVGSLCGFSSGVACEKVSLPVMCIWFLLSTKSHLHSHLAKKAHPHPYCCCGPSLLLAKVVSLLMYICLSTHLA